MEINLLTAKPAFELMLAINGFEAPYSSPRAAWDLFLKYLAVPSDAVNDSGGFQTSWLAAADQESGMVVTFSRQLTGTDGNTRSVQLQFTTGDKYEGVLEDVEVWTDDYRDLAAFAEEVEALEHFQILCGDSNPAGELFLELVD